jgi:hypothetical protein
MVKRLASMIPDERIMPNMLSIFSDNEGKAAIEFTLTSNKAFGGYSHVVFAPNWPTLPMSIACLKLACMAVY